jgi:hypothetical protein
MAQAGQMALFELGKVDASSPSPYCVVTSIPYFIWVRQIFCRSLKCCIRSDESGGDAKLNGW